MLVSIGSGQCLNENFENFFHNKIRFNPDYQTYHTGDYKKIISLLNAEFMLCEIMVLSKNILDNCEFLSEKILEKWKFYSL